MSVPLDPLEAFALHASTTCQDPCGRSFASGDVEPCPVGACLLECMSQKEKAAKWIEAEARRYGERGEVTEEQAEDAEALCGVLADGIRAGEHLKEGS